MPVFAGTMSGLLMCVVQTSLSLDQTSSVSLWPNTHKATYLCSA